MEAVEAVDRLAAHENLERVIGASLGAVTVAQRALQAPALEFAEQQYTPA